MKTVSVGVATSKAVTTSPNDTLPFPSRLKKSPEHQGILRKRRSVRQAWQRLGWSAEEPEVGQAGAGIRHLFPVKNVQSLTFVLLF